MSRELRLILTQYCQQRCIYCHKEGLKKSEKEFFNSDDYAFIFQTAREYLGIDKVTLTGGEPLTRADIIDIAKKLKIRGAKTKLITNGILLKDKYKIITYLDDISISVSTIDPINFHKVHGTNKLPEIVKGIKKINKITTKTRIRLNVCCVKNVNNNINALKALINFANKYGLVLRFIELLNAEEKITVKIEEIAELIKSLGFKEIGNIKEKRFYQYNGVLIELLRCPCRNVEVTQDIDFFCKSENDIFITPDGKIKPCMLRESGKIDILEAVRLKDARSLSLYFKQAIEQF